jgi:hypothetical protein
VWKIAMKTDPKKLLSYRQISFLLTNSKDIIRRDIPNLKYKDRIDDLLILVDHWIKKQKFYSNENYTKFIEDEIQD